MTLLHHVVAGVCAGVAALAALVVATPLHAATLGAVRSVEDTYARANSALLRGDANGWNELMPMSQDFVLFSPFGGKPSRYADYTVERIGRMSRFFRDGTFTQEIVQEFATDDMIVLAAIEHCNVAVGGLPKQDWALRVTSVFRRQGDRWVLAHRHADPFVEEVSLAESARIARGERDTAEK